MQEDFTSGRIMAPLLRFAVPVLFALFLQATYGAVDLLIVGQFASSADVSAVSTGSQIMQTFTGLVSSFAVGITVFVGQKIGEGNAAESNRIIGAGIYLFAAAGIIMSLLVVVLAVLAIHNRFYLQRFNPLELRHLQYVEIEGNRMLSWEDVMQSAQVETGMLLSELNEDSVTAALMQLPLILSAAAIVDYLLITCFYQSACYFICTYNHTNINT